jgi:acyl-CoA synthetase (AMP-forming)/AMP-acid ligase II
VDAHLLGAESTTNIAAFLPAMAALRPHGLAIVVPTGRTRSGRVAYSHLTFGQLEHESNVLARGLEQVGITRGTRTALLVKPSLEFFALTFGLFKVGAVPVLVDPGIGAGSVGRCLAEASVEAFIGVPRAHLARLALGWGRSTVRVCVTVGRRGPWSGLTLESLLQAGSAGAGPALAPTKADELAAILFTSGSTGAPKGAVYAHGNFVAQVETIRRTYGIAPGEIDLPTFPLFALFDPALGVTAIIPDMDASRPGSVDPRKLVEAIEDFGVSSMFGSPAVVNRLGRHGEVHGVTLPTLRRVLSAGAPVPGAVLERFVKLLSPGVEVFTPYGATESLPVTSIGSAEILAETLAHTRRGAGVCVGRPVDGVTVRVIGISDEAIPTWDGVRSLGPGEIGEVVAQGPSTTRAYFRRDEATRLAKIASPDGSVSHRMGDLGYFDEKGRLWYCGRKSHRVVTAAGTLFTDPCEHIFNTHRAVARTALVGVGPRGLQVPVLCVQLDEASRTVDRRQVKQELLTLGAQQTQTAGILDVRFHPSFPVDARHNAKIFREELAAWAARERG